MASRSTRLALERENERLRARVAALEAAAAAPAIEAIRQSEAKYRRLHESLRDAFVYVDPAGRILEFNDAYQRLTGYEPTELLSLTYQQLTPERWHAVEAEIIARQVMTRGHSEVYEKEYRHKDGHVIPVELRTVLMRDAAGVPSGMWAIVRDITGRKQAERVLRESESWLVSALDIAALGLYRQEGPAEDRATFLDSRARTLLGIPRDQEHRTHAYWIEHLHPEDLPRVVEVSRGFESGDVERAAVAYRYLRGPDDVVWVRHVAHAIERDGSGRAVLIVGILQDVTEQKQVEMALRESEEQSRRLSGRLMMAQEEERSRLARELHDDFSQRVALLAVQLYMLKKSPSATPAALQESINGLYAQVQSLGKDLRRMSYELHPARLEQLGLVSALRQLCGDLSDAHGVAITCHAPGMSHDLPEPVALCLYRVAQEALQNVVKHSAAAAARVELDGSARETRLVVSDDGQGFDVAVTRHAGSLGLASMAERVRSIGGRLVLESRPGKGTRIEVRVAP